MIKLWIHLFDLFLKGSASFGASISSDPSFSLSLAFKSFFGF